MTPDQSPLGKASAYADHYDAGLLYPLPRSTKREEVGITGRLPFMGADLWTAYELSWLNPRGKPQVAIAQFIVPCESTHIVESKSFKLYLNSFNNTVVASAEEVQTRLRDDLSEAIWRGGPVQARVGVHLVMPDAFDAQPIHELDGLLLDRLDAECSQYEPDPSLLTSATDEQPVTETLVSHLLKSNCLVTGQPDWGSVQISYTGPQIDQEGLLQYIVSFRNHNEFHEQCVERIYMDVLRQCQPTKLSVYARYTRRGGLDINPWRSSHPRQPPPNVRGARQ
ncbi:NADPH-dependent 7-cyano-7-deazaguanine reductase QueF [Hydrogenophaga sp. 5NK40-0174]|uniref:NADPH-dependent 7-cyano-7-deazaguanine reductase QueF n=1 Tax=Hydrogenophaga sp. 5NK40-0174 TaxID=3127649 RepID=UPI003102F05B